MLYICFLMASLLHVSSQVYAHSLVGWNNVSLDQKSKKWTTLSLKQCENQNNNDVISNQKFIKGLHSRIFVSCQGHGRFADELTKLLCQKIAVALKATSIKHCTKKLLESITQQTVQGSFTENLNHFINSSISALSIVISTNRGHVYIGQFGPTKVYRANQKTLLDLMYQQKNDSVITFSRCKPKAKDSNYFLIITNPDNKVKQTPLQAWMQPEYFQEQNLGVGIHIKKRPSKLKNVPENNTLIFAEYENFFQPQTLLAYNDQGLTDSRCPLVANVAWPVTRIKDYHEAYQKLELEADSCCQVNEKDLLITTTIDGFCAQEIPVQDIAASSTGNHCEFFPERSADYWASMLSPEEERVMSLKTSNQPFEYNFLSPEKLTPILSSNKKSKKRNKKKTITIDEQINLVQKKLKKLRVKRKKLAGKAAQQRKIREEEARKIVYNLVQSSFEEHVASSAKRSLGILNKVPHKKIKYYIKKIQVVVWKSVQHALDRFKTDQELKKFAQDYSEKIEFGFLFMKSLKALGFIASSTKQTCPSDSIIDGCAPICQVKTQKALKKKSLPCKKKSRQTQKSKRISKKSRKQKKSVIHKSKHKKSKKRRPIDHEDVLVVTSDGSSGRRFAAPKKRRGFAVDRYFRNFKRDVDCFGKAVEKPTKKSGRKSKKSPRFVVYYNGKHCSVYKKTKHMKRKKKKLAQKEKYMKKRYRKM